MKNLIRAFILALLLPTISSAESIVLGGKWGGLHNSGEEGGRASLSIGDNEALELNNVNLNDDASAVIKRGGYYQFSTIGTSTWAVRGGAFFFDVSGNGVAVFANNRSIFKSTDFTTYSAFVTTDTAGSYYDFAPLNGYLWRTTSNRDEVLRYDGTTVTYYPSLPKGTQIEFLADRGVISGTAANKNRVNFSGAADFTNYTVGTEETDPFYEDFGLQSAEVVATKSACGGLIVFSSKSIDLWTGTNQYDGRIENLTHRLGTSQPNTVIEHDGIVYFQGNDNHVYRYDCNTITRLSGPISVYNFGGSYVATEKRHFTCFDKYNRLWISIPDAVSSINDDDTLIYDTRHNAWLRYSFSAQGCFAARIEASDADVVMFGGASTGVVYGILDLPTSGNTKDGLLFVGQTGGTNFTSLWQTKYFTAGDPFTEDNYLSYSLLTTRPGVTGTLSVLYDPNRTGAFTTNNYTYTTTGSFYYQVNAKFPAGTFGKMIGFKFQNSDDAAFSMHAFQFEYQPKPWRVLP